jgi:hypothetical protein
MWVLHCRVILLRPIIAARLRGINLAVTVASGSGRASTRASADARASAPLENAKLVGTGYPKWR